MKLKCEHKRRVVIVGDPHTVLHRSDGSHCHDPRPTIGKSTVETRDPSGVLMVYAKGRQSSDIPVRYL